METDTEPLPTLSPEGVQRLVGNHRQFLGFLERRVGSRADAEEILQVAFIRGFEKGGALRDDEKVVPWFFRLLRNAVVDHQRRKTRELKLIDPDAPEADVPMDEEIRSEVCRCVGDLLPTLKPEYAEMIQRVDLQDAALSHVATELAITPNNASVRLHRARQALRRQLERSCGTCATHGCLDCSCGAKPDA